MKYYVIGHNKTMNKKEMNWFWITSLKCLRNDVQN